MQNIKYVTKDDVNAMVDRMKSKIVSDIPPGSNVFFKNVTIPITEFRKKYSCNIVKNIKEADVVVISEIEIIEDDTYETVKEVDGHFEFSAGDDDMLIFKDPTHPMKLHAWHARKVKIVEQKNVFLGDKYMDDTNFEKLLKMCNSEFHELVLKLLVNFDTKENSARLRFILMKLGEVSTRSKLSNFIQCKAVDEMDSDILKLMFENPEDDLLNLKINEHLSDGLLEGFPRIKIVKYDTTSSVQE